MRLDRKISFYKPVQSRNEFGEVVEFFDHVRDMYSMMEFGSGSSSVAGQEVQSSTDKQRVAVNRRMFTFRFYPVLETWIVEHEGLKYRILAVEEVQRRKYTKIYTEYWDNDR